MQKLRLFSSGAGPPRRPFCLVENAPFLGRCRTAVSAAASPVFLPSRRGCGQSSSSFRFSSVLFLLYFIPLTNLAAFLFWPQCSPTSCQRNALGSASSHVSSSSSPHNMLRASPVSPLLSVLPTFLRLVPCAVSNPRASHSPTQVAYSSCRVASSRLLQNGPPSPSACDEKQISCSPAGRFAAKGVLQQRPSSLSSSDFSSVAHVPVSLSFFPSLSFPLPFSPLPVLLYAQALPGSSPATEGTAVKNAAAARATPPRPPATAAAAARTPATAPTTRAAPAQTLATTEAGEPVRKRPRRAEFVSEGAELGRESSSDGLLLKSSVGVPQGRRLTDADVLSGSATAPATSSSFSLRSLFPFFSSPPSPSPPRSPGSGKSPAAEVGGQKGSSLPSSSSPSSSSSPTSFSSVPSSGAAPGGGGDSGRTEQRETAGAAGAAAAEKTEAGRSANGSSSSSSDIAAAEGGKGSKPKREGLAASLTNVNMLLLALCLLCCFTLGYFIHVNMIPHLPDSAAAMLTGVVFGLLARLWGASPSENSFLHFDPEFFYFVLLPPIVLEAGFCLNKAAFLYNLGPILLLSILGTLLSTVIIAKVTLQTAHACGLEGPPHELRGFSWVFASLISATDTVATLSIIGSPKFRLDEKGVDLYSILMGESVLNDAVSIALTRSCLRLFFTAEAEAAQRASGADVITDFLAVVVGSLVLGIGIGGCCCFCFRHSKLKKLPEYEVAITMLTAYMAFGVSECLGFSGVVSLFFCGVMLGHFNVHNMSTKSRNSIDTVFKTIALLSEKTVFAYLGVVAAVGVGQRSFNIFFVLIALSACAISRAACVFPMSFISNRFRRKDERIDWRQQVLIWLAGLRGAVAFALAMTIPCSFDFWRAVCRHNKELVVTTTLVLVAITTLGVGSILEYTAVKLGVVQPRRRSLSLHGYGAAAGPSSSSSALLLLEHRQQQEALGEEEGNGDESAAAGGEREDEDEGGEEEVRGASPGAPRLLLATSPSAGLRSEQERTAAEELLNARAAPRAESSQEMVAASALQRGPPPTAAGIQQQQQQQPDEAGTAAQRQQQLQQQRLPATTWGPARSSPSSPEQRWTADASPGRRPTYVRRDETAEAEGDLGRRDSFQRGHIRSGRFSRYDSVQHQPFNTVLRFLYRLDREFLQPWLGSSTSPSSSIVVADAPCPAESRPDNSGPGSPGAVSPCYYRPDKTAAATSDRNSNTMASPQFHRQAQQ